MIKNIIFDLDGTLIDSAEGIGYSLELAITKVFPRFSVNNADIRKFIGPPIQIILRKLLPDISEGIRHSIEIEFRKIYDEEGWRRMCLYDTTLSTLKKLGDNSIDLFLATNKPNGPAQKMIIASGISRFIKKSLSPDWNNGSNFEKYELIQILLTENHLNKFETIFVGDGLSDLEAAQKCGLDFVFAKYGYDDIVDIHNDKIKYFLNRPADLLFYITKGIVNE